MGWIRRTAREELVVNRKRPARGSGYNLYGKQLSDEQIATRAHRRRVGGYWERIGKLQFDFLIDRGLKPDHRLLDVGCGALRGGIHFIRYLDPCHYHGIDLNESLLRAGLEHELPAAGLTDRLPEANLRQTDNFACAEFGVEFDFALAVSVFSHLPLNHIRLCLYQLSKATRPGACFYASFFELAEDVPLDQPVQQRTAKGPWTHTDRDPFHYRRADLEWAARSVGSWECRYLGAWGHPRGQKMAEFIRT